MEIEKSPYWLRELLHTSGAITDVRLSLCDIIRAAINRTEEGLSIVFEFSRYVPRLIKILDIISGHFLSVSINIFIMLSKVVGND